MDVETLYQLVGERIHFERRRAGLSQEKLAKKLDMSRTSIVNIEAGKQRAPLHVLWQIAEYLNSELRLLLPNSSEYEQQSKPVSLDTEMIARIEEAANGDVDTRRKLTSFISQVKGTSKCTPRDKVNK